MRVPEPPEPGPPDDADVVAEHVAVHERVRVHGHLVTVEARPGRRGRRSSLDGPRTWPADTTTLALRRTDGTGQWRATLTSLGRDVELVVRQRRLHDLVALAEAHLGGVTVGVEEAERARVERRRQGP